MADPKDPDLRVTAGFIIVASFARMYREFKPKVGVSEPDVFSIPRVDAEPVASNKHYRGIGRDAIESWTVQDLELGFPNVSFPDEPKACLAMQRHDEQGEVSGDFILSRTAAEDVWSMLVRPQEWEMVWTRRDDARDFPPVDSSRLGFEPTWFYGDRFSAVMDSMCFPRWHGTIPNDPTLIRFHSLLNANGLFDSAEAALEFQKYYECETWAESGPYFIAEVRLVRASG